MAEIECPQCGSKFMLIKTDVRIDTKGTPPEPEPPPEAESFKVGDRVVVKDDVSDSDEPYRGKHGTIEHTSLLPPGAADVRLDGDDGRPFIWTKNLRREGQLGCKLLREDGGSLSDQWGRVMYPVGEKVEVPGAGAFVAVNGSLFLGGNGPVLAAFECEPKNLPASLVTGVVCYRHVTRLAEFPPLSAFPESLQVEIVRWREKHEPKPEPEPKFQVGQWARVRRGCLKGTVGRIVGLDDVGNVNMQEGVALLPLWYEVGDLEPHAPVLTEEQRWMLPGDEVRVIKIPVEDDGTLSVAEQPRAGTAGLVRSIWKTGMSDLPAVTLSGGSGGWHVRLHNLMPVAGAEEDGG